MNVESTGSSIQTNCNMLFQNALTCAYCCVFVVITFHCSNKCNCFVNLNAIPYRKHIRLLQASCTIAGISNTRPVRGSNAARQHQEKLIFLKEIWSQLAYFLNLVLKFKVFFFIFSMRPESQYEFETPVLKGGVHKFVTIKMFDC